MFATVNSLPSEDSLEDQWAHIFKLDREFYLDLEFDDDGNIDSSHWPDLEDNWLDPHARARYILPRPTAQVSGGVPTSTPTGVPMSSLTGMPPSTPSAADGTQDSGGAHPR